MQHPQSAPYRERPARPFARQLPLALLLLAACGGSDDSSPPGSGGGGGGGTNGLTTLSGLVLDPSGSGLANVTVRAGGVAATSNPSGQYVLTTSSFFPTEDLHVEFDGSTAGLPGQYPEVGIDVDLPADQTSATVPQVITLPDLLNPMSSNQSIDTGADGSTLAPIQVVGTEADMVLSGPVGTVVTVDGVSSAQTLELNMTAVDPGQVPMLLPGDLLGGGFVTIQPGESTFDPPGPAAGLDVMLPNDRDFPVGSVMDIWSFDHDEGAWVNRSEQTGERGTVVDLGGGQTAVEATGVITEGGWHTTTMDVDPDCATTFVIRAVDVSSGTGIPGVIVVLPGSGQVGTTGADGQVTIPLVPAYDVALLASEGVCVTTDLDYYLFFPLELGFKLSGTLTIPAADVVAGGVTDAGDYDCEVPTVGTLSGIVVGNGTSATEPVVISTAAGVVTSVVPGSGGSFFVADLEQGDYVASYDCIGDDPILEVPFTIVAGEVTSILLQCSTGTGSGDLTVQVFFDGDLGNGLPGAPLAGATVTLQGTDAGSLAGLSMLTDSTGRATFQNVNGPFNVTAQRDVMFGAGEFRLAQSVIGVEPVVNSVGIVIERANFLFFIPEGFAFLSGNVLNPPVLGAGEVLYVQATGTTLDGSAFRTQEVVASDGSYDLLAASSADLDLALVRANQSGSSQAPLETLFLFDAGNYASGASVDFDLDWNTPGRVTWDQPTNVQLSNLDPLGDLSNTSIELSLVSVAERVRYRIDLGDPTSTSLMLNLPNVDAPGLAGFDLTVEAVVDPFTAFFEDRQSCTVRLSNNMASIDLEFPNPPTLIQPANNGSYTLGEFENLLATWTLGDPAGPDSFGMESLQFYGAAPLAGSSGAVLGLWTIHAREGTSGFILPARAIPMELPGSGRIAASRTERWGGIGANFDSLFDQGANSNLEQLYAGSARFCDSAGFSVFTISQ